MTDNDFVMKIVKHHSLPIYRKKMKQKIILTFVSVLFGIVGGYAQSYDQERHVVNGFLKKHGISADSCQLELVTVKPEFLLYNSEKSNLFVLVATKKFHPNLSDPILAYGFEGGLSNGDNHIFFDLINVYRHQLNYLYNNRLKLKRNFLKSYRPKKKKISPLLGEMAWGQGAPYNEIYFRHQTGEIDKEKHLVGCVPVAMAQIMKYHAHPQQAQGMYAYKTKSGYPLKQDFSKFHFDWELMKDTYTPQDKDSVKTQMVAQLMAAVGISVGADFGKFSTSAYCERIKMALTNFFDYSPSCSYVKSKNILVNSLIQRDTFTVQSADNILGLTYRELEEKRPLIVSNSNINHAFVCDGYDGEFLHFNLGWNRYCNGFYRIIIIPGMDEYPLLYNDMVIGIQPDKYTQNAKIVNLTEVGTLESKLTNKEKKHLHTLIVNGKLNGKDMKLIRRMAGAIDDNNYFGWRGELCHLDLSRVDFVQGDDVENSYLSQSLKELGLTITFQNYEYNFSTLSNDEWKDFCKKGLNKNSEYTITEKDGNYNIHYLLKKDKIGKHLFRGCNNLRTVMLPLNLIEIGEQAFWDCHSLMYIDLPLSVSKIGSYAFGNTYLLKRVTTINEKIEAATIFNENTCILNKGIIKLKKSL